MEYEKILAFFEKDDIDGYAFECQIEFGVIYKVIRTLYDTNIQTKKIKTLVSRILKPTEFDKIPPELRKYSVFEFFEKIHINGIFIPILELGVKRDYTIDKLKTDFSYNFTRELFDVLQKNNIISDKDYQVFKDDFCFSSGLSEFTDFIISELTNPIKSIAKSFSNNNVYYLPAPSGNYERLIREKRNREYINKFSDIRYNPIDSETLDFFIKKWLKEFEIGDDIEPHNAGEYSELKIKRDGKEYDLIDMGFGMSKLLSLILSVASKSNKDNLGYYYLDYNEAINVWEILHSPCTKTITKYNTPSRLNNWYSIRKFFHPINSIIIHDNYIISNYKKVFNNLFKILKHFLPTQDIRDTIDITIITYKLYNEKIGSGSNRLYDHLS